MSRRSFLSCFVVLCAVVGCGVVGVASASASVAEPFVGPAAIVCKKVPPNAIGLYNNPHCQGNVLIGSYAWSVPLPGGLSVYCVLAVIGKTYSDELCQAGSGTGAFSTLSERAEFPLQLGLGGLSVLKGIVGGSAAEIDCTHVSFSAQPETASLTRHAKLTYRNCAVLKPKGCEVGSVGLPGLGTILTKELDGTLQSLRLALFAPEEPSTFVKLNFTGAECIIKGQTPAVEGKQMCTFKADVTSPAEEHELVCLGSESSLLLGNEPAKYEGSVKVKYEGSLLLWFTV